MSWDLSPAGPTARSLAPAAFGTWDALMSEVSAATDPAMRSLITGRIAVLFGGAAAAPVESAVNGCAEAVEQFVIDVSAMSDDQRAGVFGTLGAGSYPFFQAVYVYDFGFRLDAALNQLFGEHPVAPPVAAGTTPEDVDLWPALDRFLTEVATLAALDPVTTELVRLRGARAHNCRICQSRRNVTAIAGGADESTFDKIDFYEDSDLDERSKVALRLTDAVLWQPAAYPAGLVDQVRATFSPRETVEIVLDLVRNAANKVAVALKADQAVVTAGVEYFSVSSEGALAYGLPAPVTVAAAG